MIVFLFDISKIFTESTAIKIKIKSNEDKTREIVFRIKIEFR